jgi:hypothetical protein
MFLLLPTPALPLLLPTVRYSHFGYIQYYLGLNAEISLIAKHWIFNTIKLSKPVLSLIDVSYKLVCKVPFDFNQ